MIVTIILVIIIIILSNYCVPETYKNTHEVYDLYTNLDHYRIGDLIKGVTNVKNYKSNLDLATDTLVKFPNSIAADYIRNIESGSLHQESNLKVNKELYMHKISIVKNLLNSPTPTEEYIIIHLRVGDILDLDVYDPPSKTELHEYTENNIKTGKIYENYVKHLSYYHNIIHELKKNNINEVTIIAGSHVKCPNYKLSSYYINIIKKLFEENGISVTLRLGLHPDEDLKLAAHAKRFYGSGGGYSELLELLNNST